MWGEKAVRTPQRGLASFCYLKTLPTVLGVFGEQGVGQDSTELGKSSIPLRSALLPHPHPQVKVSRAIVLFGHLATIHQELS